MDDELLKKQTKSFNSNKVQLRVEQYLLGRQSNSSFNSNKVQLRVRYVLYRD